MTAVSSSAATLTLPGTDRVDVEATEPTASPGLVPPQGGYAAVVCPRKVHNDNDPTIPDELQDPLTPFGEALIASGIAFEDETVHAAIVEALAASGEIVVGDAGGDAAAQLAAHPRVAQLYRDADSGELIGAILDGDRSDEQKHDREQATLSCLRAGVRLVFNARLPATSDHRRIGEPDLLVRGPRRGDGQWGYHPVDVKEHADLDDTRKEQPWWVSDFDAPQLDAATPTDLGPGKPHLKDDKQLVHYVEMLADHGFDAVDADGGAWWAAIVGKPMRLVWRNLVEARYERGKRSAVDIYREAFDRAWEIAARARRRAADASLPALVEPVRIADCGECVWRTVCHDLRVDLDHPSRLQRVTTKVSEALSAQGLHRISDIAALPDGAHIADVPDPQALIDRARVFRDGRPHRKRGVPIEAVEVPRATIEVDFDIEDAFGHVYLFGARTHRRRRDGRDEQRQAEYRPFTAWEPDPQAEAEAMVAWWRYTTTLVDYAKQRRWGVRVYHYTSHERTHLRRIREAFPDMEGMPTAEELERFFSDVAVDMYEWVRTTLELPTESLGLKAVSPLAGHSWRDDDPGGANSIAWYVELLEALEAGDDARADALRERILDYNEDDDVATLVVRNWLSRLVHSRDPDRALPGVETLARRFARPRSVA